ncbi:MAG: copper chaperone CopZ [Planctomycetota bacterium]|jgi:copper chaperone CopZ
MALNGVESTSLDFAGGVLTVDYDAADLEPEALVNALAEAGYPSAVMQD